VSERLAAAYEQVALEVEKLVSLFQESQENQHQFMKEAYRLLQAQAREVEDLRDRVQLSERVLGQVEEILAHVRGEQPADTLLNEGEAVGIDLIESVSKLAQELEAEAGEGELEQEPAGERESHVFPGLHQALESQALPSQTDESPGEAGRPQQPSGQGQKPQGGPGQTQGQMKTAQVRFLHASPDGPHVDIYVDGRKAASDVEFEGISPYLPLSPGRHRIQVFLAGQKVGALIDTTSQLLPGRHYTVAAAGFFREIRPVVIEDVRSGGRPGFARMKVVNLSPNSPALDLTLKSGRILIGHLTFKEKSQYLQVTPGSRDLQVRLAGKKDIVLDLPRTKFDADITYTLFIVGQSGRLEPLFVPEA